METNDPLVEKLARRLEDEWSAWKGGAVPALESYVDWLPADRRESVLRRLIPIDAACRRVTGQPSSLEDFERRFAAHRALVRSLIGPDGEILGTGPTRGPVVPVDVEATAPLSDDEIIPFAEPDPPRAGPIRASQDVGPLPIRAGIGVPPRPAPARSRRPALESFTAVEWDAHADDPPTWYRLLRIQVWMTGACVVLLGVHLLAQYLFFSEATRQLTPTSSYDFYSYPGRLHSERNEQRMLDRQFWFQASAQALMGLLGLTVLGYLGLGGYAGLLAVRGAVAPGDPIIEKDDDDAPSRCRQMLTAYRPPPRLERLSWVVAGFAGLLLAELAVMMLGRSADSVTVLGLSNLVYLATLALGGLYWLGMTVPLMLGSADLTAPAERRWLVGLLAAIGATIGLGPVLPILAFSFAP